MTRPTQAEIDDLIQMAIETNGDLFGMTYEEGVKSALEWASGYVDDMPIEQL